MTNLQKFINEYELTTKVDESNFRSDTFDRIVQCVLKLVSEDEVKQFSIENISHYLKCIMEIVEMTADVQGHVKKILTMELMRDIITSVNGNTTVMLDVIVEKALPGMIDVIIASSKSAKLQSAVKVHKKKLLNYNPFKLLTCGCAPRKKKTVNSKDITVKQIKKHEEHIKKQEEQAKKHEEQLARKENAEKKKQEIISLQNAAKEKAEEAKLAAQKVAEAKR